MARSDWCKLVVSSVIVLIGCGADQSVNGPAPGGEPPLFSHIGCSGTVSGQCGTTFTFTPTLSPDGSIHGGFTSTPDQLDANGLPVLPLPASAPFDIVFSQPVVGINIVGTSWNVQDGGRFPSSAVLTVYDSSGNILATVQPYYLIPYDEPYSYAQWAYGLPASGPAVVGSVHFDPVGEHLPISMVFQTNLPDPASLVCSPNPVVRGSSMLCEVEDGTDVQVTGWSFTPDSDSSHVITRPTDSLSWGGPMVVPGTVSVSLTDGGTPKTLSKVIAITPRDWSSLTVPHEVIENTTDPLPNPPDSAGNLGNHGGTAGAGILPGGYETVQSGPNTGVYYLTDVPIQAFSFVYINRAAMSVGSYWYNLQPAAHARKGYCTQADVLPFIPHVEAHEGLGVEVNSHAWAFRNTLNSQVPPAEEAVTGWGFTELQDSAQARLQVPLAAAHLASEQIDITNPIEYCKFKY